MTGPRIFKPGDKVKIRDRQDSPIMKVIKYVEDKNGTTSSDTVLVEWFDKDNRSAHKEEHHQMALIKAE